MDLDNELTVNGGMGDWRGDRLGVWGQHIHTAILKRNNQQRPFV